MNKSRRAVSEIIGSLVLLAVTIVGGILVWIVISDSDVMSGISDQVLESTKSAGAVKIVGFDTRDGNDLSGITSLDNDGDGSLTTGTDFIVVKIRNTTTGFIVINSLLINEFNHVFNGTVTTLDPSINEIPDPGNFVIISTSAAVTFESAKVLDGQDARLVIALASGINGADDIELTEGIRINISASEFEVDTFIIPAGTAR